MNRERETVTSPQLSSRLSTDSSRIVVGGSGSGSGGGGGGHSPYATTTHHGTGPGSFLDLNFPGSPSHRRSSSFSIGAQSWMDLGNSVPIGLNRVEGTSGTLGNNSIAEVVGVTSQRPTGFLGGVGKPGSKPAGSLAVPGTAAANFKTPTTRDIPPVTLAPIKKVSRAELNSYLREITEEYEAFYSSRASRSSGVDSGASVVSPSVQTTLSNLSSALESVSGVAAKNNSSTNLSDIHEQPNSNTHTTEITPLDTIPSVFFEKAFQLDNPRIFDLVSEKSSIIKDGETSTPRKALAGNAILPEKLSWYIDTVELHLIQEISHASSSFFTALDDLKSINKQTAAVVDRIKRLREDLAIVDEQRAVHGIESLKLKQRRKNVEVLSQALKQVQTILDKSDHAEQLYHENKLSEALNVLDALEALIRGEKTDGNEPWITGWKFPICDVRSVHGLSDLREGLRTLRTRIGEGFSKLFADILVNDLRTHSEGVPKEATLHRMGRVLDSSRKGNNANSGSNNSKVVNMAYLEMSPDLRKQLESNVQGLIRSNDVQGAFKTYRDIVIKEAKNIVRMHLPSSSGGDNESVSSNMTGRSSTERSVSLATQLRALTPDESEIMLGDIYAGLSELFRRLSTQQKLLLDVTLSAVPPQEASESYNTAIDLSDLLKNVIDTSQSRIVKILNVRREQTASMTSTQSLLNFYSLSGIFLTECEAICGEAGTALRACITGQVKQFLLNRHRERVNSLQQFMDKAQWREEEITPEFQKIVDTIVASGSQDPDVWLDRLKQIVSDDKSDKKESDVTSTSTGKKLPKNVFLGTDSFIIPSSAVRVIQILEEYQMLAVVLPHLATDTVSHTADLVRKFNSKTTQLILSAGATRSAGLKHITAKHLALAAQGLNIVQSLVLPYMKDCGRRHVAGALSVLEEYESVSKDLQSHMQEIHNKFITLMSDKTGRHVANIAKTDWQQETDAPHKYMLDLVKDTTVLCKILNSILPKATYLVCLSLLLNSSHFFTNIFFSLEHCWHNFRQLQAPPQRGLLQTRVQVI